MRTYHLYQKHYARHCDTISTYLDAKFMRTLKTQTILLIAIPGFPILIISSVIGIHYLGTLVSIPLIILGILPVAFIIGAGTYNYNYDSPLDTRRINRLTKLLKQHGPLHTIMLLNQYQQTHHDYMNSQELELLLKDPQNRKQFTLTGNIIHLPGQSLENIVPAPPNDDYITGYHTLYRRLQAIRRQPELATVQDSLIDELYNIQ